eukprot:1695076-Ditylum_brightwellii.AAC.1
MNLLPDSPITVQDIKNVEFVFGPDLGALKGKTSCETPDQVVMDYIEVPRDLIDLHHDITVAVDIICINKVPFLTSVSRKSSSQLHKC